VGTTEPYFPYVSGGAGAVSILNAGQRAFAATAPSGFKALCTANLPAPTITKPSTVMDVKLWTGNGTSQSITTDFSPDFVWIKDRSTTQNHALFDSVRGATNRLFSNLTNAEAAQSGSLTSFNSNGFSIGDGAAVNASAASYVGWTWDAGSSTVTNTAGTISSQVRANASAGFSIVTYTSNGTNGATIGHGLGIAPQFVIVKNRLNGTNWTVGHQSLDATSPWNYYLLLNSTNARAAASVFWNNTSPSSSVITLGTSTSVNSIDGDPYVAYCFAPVAGYSSFGSYTGNNSADGPFCFTGFRPRWLLIKSSSYAADWVIIDAARETYNVMSKALFPNREYYEAQSSTNLRVDFLSNGFKLRSTDANAEGWNYPSNTHIYAAFAESPFQYARAR
jgi:hypothetical protein